MEEGLSSQSRPPREVPALLSIALEFSRLTWTFGIPRRRQRLQSQSVILDMQALVISQPLPMPYSPLSLADSYFLEPLALQTMPWPPVAARPEQLGAE